MKFNPDPAASWLGALALAVCVSARAALPPDWQHAQPFELTAPGLVKFSLPAETLNAARPGLEDLRLCDTAGNLLPFLVKSPVPAPRRLQEAKSFSVSLNPASTVLTLETAAAEAVEGVQLDTPASGFLKAVLVEGSADGRNWHPLAQGRPIFRQANGASHVQVAFPAGAWLWLRLTVDDQRSPPIPFTGARLEAAATEDAPLEPVPATLVGRDEPPGETRLTLNLGAAHLTVASVQLETTEPLFTRQVTLAVPQVTDSVVREQTLGQGCVYRVAIEGLPPAAHLTLPLEARVDSRELVLRVDNQESPPLPVSAVRVLRRPVYVVFLARAAGKYYLLTGNRRCAAPHYDLAALDANLKSAPLSASALSGLADNPDYRAPEALAGIELGGPALEVADWSYRKPVTVSRGGAQQLYLDLDVLAHADAGFADLRLLRGSNQVPYLLHCSSLSRALTPSVTRTNDARRPKLSRWILRLPAAHLPLTRLSCVTRSPLFQREVTLHEEVADDRGAKRCRALGGATWIQTPDRQSRTFVLTLNDRPETDTLYLETENGDNPPIELEGFTAFYPASRLLFKAKPEDGLLLYYGNPRVAPPRYDLTLVAGQLLGADPAAATLAAEVSLKKPSWQENQVPGQGGVLLWSVLAVVVVGLLGLIARLLPKPPPPA